MMNPQYEDEDPQGRIQRILNDKKRKELEEKFEITSFVEESKLSADEEAQYLDYLEEFERQFNATEQITLRAYLGCPDIKPIENLHPDDFTRELDNILNLMAHHNVYLDFLCNVDEEEIYRFVVEELMDQKVDDIRIPGMNLHFIYEEFHPNIEYDIKSCTDNFLYALLYGEQEQVVMTMAADELYDRCGMPTDRADVSKELEAFFARNPIIIDVSVGPLSYTLDGKYATVETSVSWTSLQFEIGDVVEHTGLARLSMKRNHYGGWAIVQAIIPGWHTLNVNQLSAGCSNE